MPPPIKRRIGLKFKDLIEDGVIDPTDVVVNALKNAVSVSSLILTTEVGITNISVEKQKERNIVGSIL